MRGPLPTAHGAERVAERVGGNKSSASRIAARALAQGLRESEAGGRLGRYLGHLGESHHTTPIVYGEHVYCFAGERLVTVVPLPHRLRSAARKRLASKAKGATP